jgi:mersacidin/lichenicidin family type 2 lantibiotic
MSNEEIIRSWKDPAYRAGFSESQLRAFPANPAGVVELNERDLDDASGATAEECETDGALTIIGGITIGTKIMSCFPSCGSSAWVGSCAFASIGCCPI